jgi:hypothetical protein
LTEERAATIRNLLRAVALKRPEYDVTRHLELAGMLVLTSDRMAQQVPAMLDKARWPAEARQALSSG